MEEKIKFKGFPSSPQTNYWPYPKALNGWWHQLSGSEQKVLDYILRHTWGFKKTADKISLTQMEKGIKKLDKGTGLSRKSIIKAINGLVKKLFIQKIQTKGKINLYSLVEEIHYPSGENTLVASGESTHTIKDITIKDIQYSEDFEIFWKLYPKKVGKGLAYKIWARLKPNPILQNLILEAVKGQKKSRQWREDDGKYIPHPSTWLNQRRWEDEAPKVKKLNEGW